MGTMAGHTCFYSSAEAQDAYFSAIAPVSTSFGDLVSYQKIISSWHRVTVHADQTVLSVPATVPVLTECDPMQGFNDGITFGMLLVGAVIAAAMVAFLSKAK